MNKKNWLKRLLSSDNQAEDQNRRELILNILLGVSTLSFLIINIIRVCDYFIYEELQGLPFWTTFLILVFFVFLFLLSKKGKAKLAAYLLIATYSLPMFYSFATWGTDLPAALLLAVLIITLSGILINEKLALISTGIISLVLILLTIGQTRGLITVQNYWRSAATTLGDIIAYSVLLVIIAFVAWLFARGLNKALRQVQQSELELKFERDSLEVKVAERTAELRQVEAEKVNQLYRLAEFGRLSSGIFHDLINPLTAVSLNLEQVNNETESKIIDAKSYLGQALLATKKMENLIASIKKQLQKDSRPTLFIINEEIEQIIQIFSYKARRALVKITFVASKTINFYGDAVKFGQIISNLLANAIEACENSQIEKTVEIRLEQKPGNILIEVKDDGSGIDQENLEKIFEPFFSTKKETNRGLGLGLASTKNLVEKEFGGQIYVSSQVNKGTEFIIHLPCEKTE